MSTVAPVTIHYLSFSFLAALCALLMFLLIEHYRRRRIGIYRVFLMVFLPVLAMFVWFLPVPSKLMGLIAIVLLIGGMTVALSLKTIPPPQGREQTIQLLKRLENERRLNNSFTPILSFLYWGVIGMLLMIITLGVLR